MSSLYCFFAHSVLSDDMILLGGMVEYCILCAGLTAVPSCVLRENKKKCALYWHVEPVVKLQQVAAVLGGEAATCTLIILQVSMSLFCTVCLQCLCPSFLLRHVDMNKSTKMCA